MDQNRLSDQAFLLGLITVRPELRWVSASAGHRSLVKAAVLAELWRAGLIRDDGGDVVTAVPSGQRPAHLEPFQAAVLRKIRESQPRSWEYWVRQDTRAPYVAVRARLEQQQAIRVRQRTLLGFSWTQSKLQDAAPCRELIDRCRDAALGTGPAESVLPRDAALAALMAADENGTVFRRRELRAQRERIAQLAQQCGPVAEALRSVVIARKSES